MRHTDNYETPVCTEMACLSPSPRVLAELPAFLRLPLHRSKGLSRASENRWQIILLIFQTTCEYSYGRSSDSSDHCAIQNQ